MNDLSLLAHLIARRRAPLAILLFAIALICVQPLLVFAKQATRDRSQLAELAQVTPVPSEEENEGTAEPPAEESDGEVEEDELEDGATATVAAPTETAPPLDQPNLTMPDAQATSVITVEIPLEEGDTGKSYAVPLAWDGDVTISAQELAQVASPLQAEVSQGDFQITFVPAPSGDETGNSLRILPLLPAGSTGTMRLGMKIDPSSANPPFPAGQTLLAQLSVRVYAPEATARLLIADDLGSSSVPLEGLNWADYQVTRQIDDAVTSIEVLLEWRNVPANGWLELRGLQFALLDEDQAATLSPTDTPVVIESVTVAPTAPLVTRAPTAAAIATATPLPTATPIPDIVAAPNAANSGAAESSTEAVTDTAVLTPTPTFIVVTSTPTPVDVFEEATRVAQATDWARILGPATPTPANLATPTPTLTPFIIALVNTPTPANAATATQAAILATAIAFTTGTPTPLPPEAIVMVATDTPVPPAPTARPTATPTPIFVLLENIPVAEPEATPAIPAILEGKIVFMTAYRGNPRSPNAMVINPDGTGVGLLTTNHFYWEAAARDGYSADRRFRVYNMNEGGGEAHNAGRTQIFYDDALYNSTQHQLTYHGAGATWAPTWSPTSETIAYVSAVTGNDEIWITQRGQWPSTQLTNNEWEWDHHPSFSPDGSQIVFSSNRVSGRRQLWIMSSSGESPRQLTNFPFEAWDPVWVKYVEGE